MGEYEERVKQREAELELAIDLAKVLIEELGQEKALEIMEKAWIKYGTDNMNRQLEGIPSEDRLKAVGEWFKEQEVTRPGLKIVEATPKRVCIEISKCLTYEVCVKHGLPEICQRYCDSDYVVAKAIHPKVRLVRDKEIAYGADYCNHCWIMES